MEQLQDGTNHLSDNLIRRVEYIDIVRALGILLMIMGHIGFGQLFDKWIHSFHMPMFFIISGLFYKNRAIQEVFRKRFKTLIVPYIIFGIFHYMIYVLIIAHRFEIEPLFILFWNNTKDSGPAIAGALWFLTSLFLVELFYCMIDRLKSTSLESFAVIILALLGMVLGQMKYRLPFAADTAFVNICFYHFGRLTQNKANYLKLNVFFSIILIALSTILCLINGAVNFRTAVYSIWPITLMTPVLMTIGLLNIIREFSDHFRNYLTRGLCFIGYNSIVYLCLNQITILIARKIGRFAHLFDRNEKLSESVFLFFLVVLLCSVEALIFQFSPLSEVLGKAGKRKGQK